MKTSVFLTDDLAPSDLELIREVASASDATFSNLVRVCNFDPTSDFRNANLRDVDFSDADLRGFDFTGSDLRGACGQNFIVDQSTILDDAIVDGSIFEARPITDMETDPELLETLRRSHWTNQLIALERELRRTDITQSSKLSTATLLFTMGKDSFIRRNALHAMSEMMPIDDFIRFVSEQLHKGYHAPLEVLSAALHIVDRVYAAQPAACLRFLLRLLDEDASFAPHAAGSLARNIQLSDLPRMASFIKRRKDPMVRQAFMTEMAKRFGPVHLLLVRDPLSGETFDFDTTVTDKVFKSIVRLVTRRLQAEIRDGSNLEMPLNKALGYPANEKAVGSLLRPMYRQLGKLGGPTIGF